MSTTISQTDELGTDTDSETGSPAEVAHDESREAPTPVVVRRNAAFAALVGAAASAIAIAYLWRATQSASPLDWALCAVMAAIGAIYLAHFVDARTPLLVADDLGVRLRLGRQWRGLPWDAVEAVVVAPRRGLLRDGRLVFAPHSIERALDGLDGRGRRAASLNQKLYGAALAVPMGITTRVSAPGEALATALAELAEERAEVVVEAAVRPAEQSSQSPESLESPESAESAESAESPAEPVLEQEVEPEIEPLTWWAAEPEPTDEAALAPEAGELEQPDESEETAAASPRRRRSLTGGLATFVSRVAKGRSHDIDATEEPDQDAPEDAEPAPDADLAADLDTGSGPADEAEPEPTTPAIPVQPTAKSRSVLPLRVMRRGSRADLTRPGAPAELGNAALARGHDEDARPTELPESVELRRDHDHHLDEPSVVVHPDDGVRPISRLGEVVEPLVIDDFATEPASDPVIGPELAAARTRVGLTVDELADRTRIRPHVIESIEVDDFAPCGGDFYARGHLRTLARVLGRDPEPLLAMFDNRYATAPIAASRVFEAELATGGMTGGVRRGVGGPNWALLVGVVLALVLVWGVIRLFASEPQEVLQPATPVLNGSAGVDGGAAAKPGGGAAVLTAPKPMHVTLVGAQDDSHVVVRDRNGKVVWAGEIVLGEKRKVQALPPVKVHAKVGGAIEAYVKGQDRGPVGATGQPGVLTLTRPAR